MPKVVPKQETFNRCVEHLRKQKAKAVISVKGSIDVGAYKSMNGNRGPIGYLLGDHCIQEMEGRTVLDENMRFILKNIHGHSIELCSDFQELHDHLHPKYWEGEMQCIAVKHNCTYTPPEGYREPKQIVDELIGYLVQGKFIYWNKIHEAELRSTWPKPIPIHKSNLGNYSQVCSRSREVVIEGLKNKFDKPVCLFPY